MTKQSVGAGLVAAGLALAAGGVAVASASSGGPASLRGCYATRTGALRLLTSTRDSCTSPERAVSWSTSAISWKGAWHTATAYSAGDAVQYAGSSYLATRGSTGKAPALSPSFWSVLAASGQPGHRGPSGPSGAGGPSGPSGPPGTGNYAEFYQLGVTTDFITSGSSLPFTTAGPQSGSVVTAGVSNTWTFNAAGTYAVTVSVPFGAAGAYRLLLNGVAVPGSSAVSDVAAQTTETVVLTSVLAGETLQVINPSSVTDLIVGTLATVNSDSVLLIEQIS